MNFYKHHLGDYDGATMHLSWDEDMAYTRLLRVYYRDEKPLPLEPRQVYRLTRAQSRIQRQAIDDVLKEFFERSEDGWHNKRADQEIASAKASSEAAKASANARWKHANASDPHMRNGSERNANASDPHDVRNAIQTPDSISHYPDTRHHTPSAPLRVSRAGARERVGSFQKPAWIPPKTADELEREEAERTAGESSAKINPIQALGGGHADG